MNIYSVYVDDSDEYGESVYKLIIPAFDESQVREYLSDCNFKHIIMLKKLEKPFISNEKIIDALRRNGFGKFEIDVISRALAMIDIAQ